MVATRIPQIARHAAPESWTRAQRANLELRLAGLGTTISELSDALELAGRPRLSGSTPDQRAQAVRELAAGTLCVTTARSCRAWLVEQLQTLPEEVARAARIDLGLGRSRSLRLGELSAVLGWALETLPTSARRTVLVTPYVSDEDLFAAAGGV